MPVSKIIFTFTCCVLFLFNNLVKTNAQVQTNTADSHTDETIGVSVNYEKPVHIKPKHIANLPKAIRETSGLVFFSGELWTINDSGNPPELFRIETTTGKILRKTTLANSVNTDWESLTQDDSSVYVGDFGNNYGNRRNLCILKIAKTDILDSLNDTVKAEAIFFTYPDQTDFDPSLNKTGFDCEAFFYYNHSLHIFTKDWVGLKTRHYTLPTEAGKYQTVFVEQFEADGLITDASINNQGNIVLLGYKKSGSRFWDCFCWTLSGYSNNYLFNGNALRIELGSAFNLGQSEGIVINAGNTAWLSSESIRLRCLHRPAKLFSINLSKYF